MMMQQTGITRYFRNYLVHQAIEATQKSTGTPIMVSAARGISDNINAAVRQAQQSGADLFTAFPHAVNQVLHDQLEGYAGLLDQGTDSPFYQQVRQQFVEMVNDRDMLPISPYDNQWRQRSTVHRAGQELRYLTGYDVLNKGPQATGAYRQRFGLAPNAPDPTPVMAVSQYVGNDLQLQYMDNEGVLQDAGPAFSREDRSGLTELSLRMSQEEYRDIRDHVLALEDDQFMSEHATARAAAVLDDLRFRGVEYDIARDRRTGQVKARIAGTKMEIRIMDTAENEHYAGTRVYEDGMVTYFRTTRRVETADGRSMENYHASPREAIDLVRVAQGLPVARWDDPSVRVGHPGSYEFRGKQSPNAYMPKGRGDAKMSMVIGDYGPDGDKVMVYRNAANRSLPTAYLGQDPEGQQRAVDRATEDVQRHVASARENFTAALDVDRLITEYAEQAEQAQSGEYVPEFSGDDEIAAIQRAYWDTLRGEQDVLLRPGVDQQMFREEVAAIDQMNLEPEAAHYLFQTRLGELSYANSNLSRVDQVRAHAAEAADEMIGTFEPRDRTVDGAVVTQRFHPARVAQYMTSDKGYWGNRDDLIAAMRAMGLTADELMGEGYQVDSLKDQLIQFDPSTAKPFNEVEDPSLRAMLNVVGHSLVNAGAQPVSLELDDNGIVRYVATRQHGVVDAEARPFTGYIGQLFPQGEYGEVVTTFHASQDFMMVPGYLASIAPQRPGENLSVEERTRLRGFDQVMRDRIAHQIASDVMNPRTEAGAPTSLNTVYRGLYDTRHSPDFVQEAREQGLSDQQIDAILSTESRRVRYSNEIAAGSTLHAEWRAKNGREQDMTNDLHDDAWVRTGGRNMVIMTEESDGYFDPVMTNGATGQGTVRFLVESAQVNADGTITRGELDDRAPLRKLPEMVSTEFDPYDRQQMTASNLMNASGVASGTRTAMMTFGGWTFDDPVVVSQDFAQRHQIRGGDGQLRPLIPGDKVSDFHGNKGVISLVVDPMMDPAEAEEQGLSKAVQVFAENPDLDVVMSPFSATSRLNGGTARELMQDPQELRLPDGSVLPGGTGEMNLIITHKDVESGTRVYDKEEVAAGRGRKASAQLAWALGSQEAHEIMKEFYGPNTSATANFREYLIAMGLDMDPDGTLQPGFTEETLAERQIFELPPLRRSDPSARQVIGTVNHGAMNTAFAQQIDAAGGFMEIPFELKLPNGETTPAVEGKEHTYLLPVLSSHLRSGQSLDDGVSVAHDYTRQYLQIFRAANEYRDAQERAAKGAETKQSARKGELAPGQAQQAFDSITHDIQQRRFAGKSNIFKEGLMSARQPNSATAVWTADPRLDIDQVSMSSTMAESMQLSEDDHVMIWRDPVLRDSGVRYMRVAIDDRLAGIAINPVMDKSFDGDFDGDSVGVVALQSKTAQQEAMQKLSVEANLLDTGIVDDIGLHPLNIQDGLDVKVATYRDPELAERFEELTLRANDIHFDWKSGELTDQQRLAANREVMEGLNEFYHDALSNEYGNAALQFDSAESHLQSVTEACVDTKAKGSPSKVQDYGQYLGVDVSFAEGEGKPSELLRVGQDHGHTQHTREQEQGSMRAVAVKTFGTGIAGAYSQRGVKALRNEELNAVLELTYPATQSILQSKHDPIEADVKYQVLLGPGRAHWRGAKLEKQPDGTFDAVYDENGEEVRLHKDAWKQQFVEFYEDPKGMNISGMSADNIEKVAEALSDPQTGMMLDMEDLDTMIEKGKRVSLMDRLAYGGDFDMLHEAAQEQANIFDGELNGHFAPHQVQQAQQVKDELKFAVEHDLPMTVDELAPKYQQATIPDVYRPDHDRAKARGSQRRSQYAPVAQGPRTARPVMVPEPVEPVVPEPPQSSAQTVVPTFGQPAAPAGPMAGSNGSVLPVFGQDSTPAPSHDDGPSFG